METPPTIGQAPLTDEQKVQAVLDKYIELQELVSKKARVTNNRKKHVANLINYHSHEDLILILKYVHTAQDHYATWMRGNNHAHFSSIFRVKKIKDKLDRARSWVTESANAEKVAEKANQAYLDDFNTVKLPFVIRG